MNRRSFLKPTTSRPATPARAVQTGLAEYTGPWTANEVAHLLKRTMFGAKRSDVEYFVQKNIADSVDELLSDPPVVDPPLRDYVMLHDNDGTAFEDNSIPLGQTWINELNKGSDPGMASAIKSARIDSLRKWWVGLMLNQQTNIGEKMVLFWHHHFSVQREEVDNCTHLYRHHELLRKNVLGNVRDLTKKVTVDPAMLLHLNGYLNSKRAPDENYARELQELFTIGKGDDSKYTEDDVRQAARVLTGWRIDDETLTAYLDTDKHDTGNKTFSPFYAATTISGNTDAEAEVSDFIDMIFATSECAKFLCRKLYRWFVYAQIDDTVEATVITPLAEIMRNNNYEIKPVLLALFRSEHFFDVANRACYIKSPLDFLVGAFRELEIPVPAYTDYNTGYALFENIYTQAAEMQQDLFQPPDVSGWPAYYQDPMFYDMWVNSNTLPKRANFTDDLIKQNIVDCRMLVQNTSNPSDPDQLVADIIASFLRYPLSDNGKVYVKTTFLLQGSTDDTQWSTAWNNADNNYINSALSGLFKFLLNLPEYHLC